MRYKARETALMGLCVALAMIFSYVEVLLPPLLVAVPGVKIGLANVVILFVLYRFGAVNAVTVSLLRVFLLFLMFGNAVSLAYSAAGAVLSLAVMLLLKKTGLFSVVGVSVAGGIAHNVGQIVMAIFLLGVAEIGYYLIVLAITGCLFGAVVGFLGALAQRRIPKLPFERDLP